ncbi:alginate export family protein [Sphingomonas sp. SUN019]|uniref:alginate export family protein n=1 Tax=Sphingomonas sp. SUN019 TaxID=2937788 RepID=UPI0021649D0D|nr:alginate export family protein [Sphingomonas sp. SUN019]UVO49913.1 alginate export family protein [Sphingomonas sp. SUN019]
MLPIAQATYAQQQMPVTPGPADRESSGDHFERTPEHGSADVPAQRPSYKLGRWLEDWRALADPELRTDPFDAVKYIALGTDGGAHLTLSGQLREEAVGQSNALFSNAGDVWGLHRLYLGADLHVGQARIYAELGNAVAIGRRGGPGPTDEDRLDLQLAFADWRLQAGGVEWVIRAGRQELAFDPTQRFVGVREGPNLRQAFDAMRLNARVGDVHVSAFAGRPVRYRPGVFDDAANDASAFRGLYASRTSGQMWTSLYVYGYRRDAARFGAVEGRERRTAWGARIADRVGNLDFDVEAMVQRGTVDRTPVRAWAIAALAGWTFHRAPWAPRAGIQLDLASGDRDPSDNRVGTFNPLFYKGNYFTEAPIGSLANVRHLKLSLSARPTKATTMSVSAADLARTRSGDLVYLAPLVPQPASAAAAGRHIGGYVQGLVSHQFSRHLSVSLEAAHFESGSAMRRVGGRNVDFAKLTANFLF